MDEKNKLVLQMGIFFILVFGIFTYIVINEKKYIVLAPKIEEKMNKYIDKEFAKEKIDLNIGKIKYDINNRDYTIKLKNNKNNNLYFYVIYKNKKITDTYKKDYLEGRSLFNYIKNDYKKSFKNSDLKFTRNLDKYPNTIYEQIITGNIKTLPIYNVRKELSLEDHKLDSITTSINKFYKKNKKLGYNPKEYEIILVDKNDIKFSVKIYNLTEEIINNSLNDLISGILNNDRNIIDKYNIKYEYIN